MRKILVLSVLLYSLLFSSQTISSKRWTDLFSYNNVLVIRQNKEKLIAATENGIFYYTPASGEITKLSKANGLHEVKITAFDFSEELQIGIVGYKSGALDVITPEGVTYVVDIPIARGYNGDKKINHISVSGNRAVISADYGVSIFNLERKEFGDSAFFVQGVGTYDAVAKAVIKDGAVYAATAKGLKKHALDGSFPLYPEWQTVATGNISQLAAGNTIVYATNMQAFRGDGNSFSALGQSFTNIRDVYIKDDQIIVTDESSVNVFSTGGAAVRKVNYEENLTTALVAGSQVFAGSSLAGILTETGSIIKPDGPYNNTSYKISILDDKLWVSTGNRTDRYNQPSPPQGNLGFYHYTGTEWIYPSFFKDSDLVFNVMDVVANPSDLGEVFFTNYIYSASRGVYKMKYDAGRKDFDFVKLYQTGRNQLYGRAVGLVFDEQNQLFGSIGYYDGEDPIAHAAVMSYDRAADTFRYKSFKVSSGVQKPVISDGFIWVPLPRNNILAAVDYKKTVNFSDDEVFFIDRNSGLPSNSEGTISFALDRDGDAWIGTDSGLRILPSAASAIRNNPKVSPVIIEENGIGEELFRDTSVLQIEVDAGNRKWVSAADAGVLYLNSSGDRTLLQFTKENSPLPNNSVTDIKVDKKTGKVYFVTTDGIVVYQGDVLDVTENFGDVLVYPNPVIHAQYKGNVKIRGLAVKTNIRITDAAGNLVHQSVARGGSYEWNLTNQRGVRVASGIYFVLMTNADGTDTATAKIAVVN